MTEIILDDGHIRRFVTPTGSDDPIVLGLRKQQYLRTVRGLAATRDKLLDEAPDLACQTGFPDILLYISNSAASTQQKVIGYPTTAFWVDVALDLLQRRAHKMFPELHIRTHLESFGRVGLAIAHFREDFFECNLRVDSKGGISLPGTSVYYSLDGGKPYQLFQVQYKNGELSARALDNNEEYSVSRKIIPKVAQFELNATDEDLRLPGRYEFEFELPLRDADIIRWQCPAETSRDWITASDCLLASEIDTSVRAIVPVRSQNPEVHISATFREAPGLMALSWTPDTPVLAEAFVHEYHHGKLNTLFAVDGLISGPTKEAIFYSPWRPDPRPLVGLLHGAFAFHAVADFWIKFLDKQIPFLHEKRLRQRLSMLCRQTKQAVETIAAEGSFTRTGTVLVEELGRRIGVCDSLVSGDRDATGRIERVMKEHKEQWDKEHGSVSERARSSPSMNSSVAEPPLPISIDYLAYQFDGDDPIIEDLTTANDHGRLDSAIAKWVTISTDASAPLLEELIRAHAAYVVGRFEDAGSGYGYLLQHYPASRYFWQCLGHCLRHLNEVDVGTNILTNLTKISAEACRSESDFQESLRERANHAMSLLGGAEGTSA